MKDKCSYDSDQYGHKYITNHKFTIEPLTGFQLRTSRIGNKKARLNAGTFAANVIVHKQIFKAVKGSKLTGDILTGKSGML